LTPDGDTAKEIIHRIALASSAFNKPRNIWTSKTLSRTTKLSLFNSNITPILSYCCESWKATITLENKINTFENKCLRTILNIKWNDFKPNTAVREESKQFYISSYISKRRWIYIGHVLRMNIQRIPHQAFLWTAAGRRSRGRPRETLRRTILRETKSMRLNNIQDLKELAVQLPKWRAIVTALCAAHGPGGL
jgi:hypothetical protein